MPQAVRALKPPSNAKLVNVCAERGDGSGGGKLGCQRSACLCRFTVHMPINITQEGRAVNLPVRHCVGQAEVRHGGLNYGHAVSGTD
jgi:hypothetical protein